MEKDFTGWHSLKEELNGHHKAPSFLQRDIWWCSVGINIGHEVDGKHEYYHRPVLVFRKFNPHVFLGIPMSTVVKNNPHYLTIHFKEKEQALMLSQIRLFDAKRLHDRMGQLSEAKFRKVKQALRKLLLL